MQGADPANLGDIHGDIMRSSNVVMNTSDSDRRNRNTGIINGDSFEGRPMNVSHSSLAGDPWLNSRALERKVDPLAFGRPFTTVLIGKHVQRKLRFSRIEGSINLVSQSIDCGTDLIFKVVHAFFRGIHSAGERIRGIDGHGDCRAIACLRKLGNLSIANRCWTVSEVLRRSEERCLRPGGLRRHRLRGRRLQIQYRLSQDNRGNRFHNSFFSLKSFKPKNGISIPSMLEAAEGIITVFRRIETQEHVRLFRVHTGKVLDVVLQNFGVGILYRSLQVNDDTPFDILFQHVLSILGKGVGENFTDGVSEMIG